ncbi:hypothetical protein [Streptomyces echinatus]|uniref:Ricin B lectin domain-containing protein n=1 Tax=Streptomyces echinatus TaxID=67293 RepID=A0A7W9UUZ0_9ACTN|nr:hypothetical protein [Streptomyces echinatus]MBB5932148.1 hypothetical protein [Streptomyces echinatus]
MSINRTMSARRAIATVVASLGLGTALLGTTLAPTAGAAEATASSVARSSMGIPGAVIIESAAFPGKILCSTPADDSLLLKTVNTRDRYCQWLVTKGSDDEDNVYTLYNPAKDQVMAYTGGNEGAVVMADYDPSQRAQEWSWGGREDWGGRALQSFMDKGQNVDAKSRDGEGPTSEAIHTRGWRHGHQRELTWNTVTL